MSGKKTTQSLQGKFLVASEDLRGSEFHRAVVLLIRHDEEGALGLILNRPTKANINDVWSEVSESPCLREDLLHLGGPCEGPLMAVHTDEESGEVRVGRGIYFSVEKENLEALAADPQETIRFFAGYAGWEAGQLEHEIAAGAWEVTAADAEEIFAGDDEQWRRVRGSGKMAAIETEPPMDARVIPPDPTLN